MMWQLTESANAGVARNHANHPAHFMSFALALPDGVVAGISARTRRMYVDVRNAVGRQSNDSRAPLCDAGFVDARLEQPARGRGFGVETVEDEIAETVDDGLAPIDLRALRHVWMTPHHHGRA